MNLDLMLLLGHQFPETPFDGMRQMTGHLQNEGHGVKEKRIRRLMRRRREIHSRSIRSPDRMAWLIPRTNF